MSDQLARFVRPGGWAFRLSLAWLVFVCTCLCAWTSRGSELRQTPIVKAAQRARGAVVNIRGEKTVTTTVSQPGGVEGSRRVNGMGTGVVIDPRGYIITNYHVVDGVREIQVTMADEKHYAAALLARDLETDLAIIKIDYTGQVPTIAVGTSSDLMPGETVIAVGNAYGYEHTVTRGIISALHRAVQVSDAQFYDDLIQTDASINPGNSGGPLLNIDGEMIGINVAVRAGAQGIGFAIPADKAMAVAAKLLGSAQVQRTWHGVTAAPDSPAGEKGVVVATVDKNSPAAEGGVQPGDVITSFGDYEVNRSLDLQRAMLDRKPDEKVSISVRRSGRPLTLNLVLVELPEQLKPRARPLWDVLGLELKPVPPQEFHEAYQTRYHGGLVVADVRPDSPAAAQGIRPGDVLVGMHIWETVSLENVSYILKRPDFASLSPIKFFILRGSDTLYGFLPVNVKTAQR